MKKLGCLAVALLIAACSQSGVGSDVLQGSPESIGSLITPEEGFEEVGQENDSALLPAHKTLNEEDAIGKADGYDPRDSHAYYEFTAAPKDVAEIPAEFEPTQGLLMAWPSSTLLSSFFVDLVSNASQSAPIIIVYVSSDAQATTLRNRLAKTNANLDVVHFVNYAADTIWMRDFGPLLARTSSGGYRIIDLRYYYGRWSDDVFPTLLANSWGVNISRPPLEGEGGNFQSDGQGNCIATKQLLNQNYSRGYNEDDIKDVLKDYFGCKSTVLLPTLYGEGTGHVDMYATITAPKEVIVGEYSLSDDAQNASVVDSAATMLKNAGYKVRRIPMPSNYDGAFRSYTNSLVVEDQVLVPTYTDDTRYEKDALAVFQDAYPNHQIVKVDSTDVIQMAGAVHCVTMTLGL